MLDNRKTVVRFLVGLREFLLLHSVYTSSDPSPTSAEMNTGLLTEEANLSAREPDSASPSSVEIKYFQSSTFTLRRLHCIVFNEAQRQLDLCLSLKDRNKARDMFLGASNSRES
jgi:hypothetical protein